MTSILETKLRSLRDEGRKGVIPFVSAGDPNLDVTREVILSLADAGAAAIEVGVPFSDPIADGPTIQWASQRALENGASLDGILKMLEGVRAHTDVPLVLFSYLNPMSAMGYEVLAARAKAVGVSGVLVTDAPPGTEIEFEHALTTHDLDSIVLVAPTTPAARLEHLASKGCGFLYIIARRGVTGKGGEQEEATGNITGLRAHTDLPLYVGFGVRTREDVVRLGEVSDGVIVGSALVDLLYRTEDHHKRPQVAGAFLRELLGTT